MIDTVVGDDAIVIRVLEKIELAARRTQHHPFEHNKFEAFAEELLSIIAGIRHAQPRR